MIDWAKPVETTETPPRPVRVLATDLDGLYPVVGVVRDSSGADFVWRFTANGRTTTTRQLVEGEVSLRNVAPPKPEPVLREAWVNCYAVDNIIGHATKEAADKHGRPDHREACLKVAWMSDGSPVPGEDDPVRYGVCETCVEKAVKWCDELMAERDSLKRQAKEDDVQIEHLHSSVEVLKAEVERLNKANLRLLGEIGQMRPVVDAAVAWANGLGYRPTGSYYLPVYDAVRTFQNTQPATSSQEQIAKIEQPWSSPKKTAAEAVANVAAMMGPVKNCTTCGSLSDRATCQKGCWSQCIQSEYGNWGTRAMTDYNGLIQRLISEANDTKHMLGHASSLHTAAADAIKELVDERDRLLLEADPELPTIAYMTGAHDWKVRAEKAEADLGNLLAIMLGDGGHYQQECGTDSALKEATELWYAYISLADNLKADLAAARKALEQDCAGCIHAPECEGENYDEECMNCRRFYGDLFSIETARAEGGE